MLPSEIKYILQHPRHLSSWRRIKSRLIKYWPYVMNSRLSEDHLLGFKGHVQYDDPMLMNFTELLEVGQGFARENPEFFETSIEKVTKDDIAVISYTSGTTGLPKGVILTHANLLDNAYRVAMSVEMKRPANIYPTSPRHGARNRSVGSPLDSWSLSNSTSREKPETVLENIRELGAEIWYST